MTPIIKTLRSFAFVGALLLGATSARALTSAPPTLTPGMVLYGTSAWSDLYTSAHPDMTGKLYKVDPATGASLGSIPLWCANKAYGNNNGLARNPISGVVYGIFTLDASETRNHRYLCTVNLSTGQISPVGGDTGGVGIAAIAFDAGGYLYGMEGDGGDFYSIDLSSGQVHDLFSVSNSGGLGLSYDKDQDNFVALNGANLTRFDTGGTYFIQSSALGSWDAYALLSLGQDWFYAARDNNADGNSSDLWALRDDGVGYRVGRLPDQLKGLIAAPDVAFAVPVPTPTPTPLAYGGQVLYTSNKNQNTIDKRTTTGDVTDSIQMYNPTQNVSGGFNAMVKSPSGVIYGTLTEAGADCVRCLATIDLSTGHVTPLGAISDNTRMRSIAFTSDGKLWGVTGQQGYHTYDIMQIDPATGAGSPFMDIRSIDPSFAYYQKFVAADPSGTKLIVGGRTNTGYNLFLLDLNTKASSRLNTHGIMLEDNLGALVRVSGNQYLAISGRQGYVQSFDYGSLTFGPPLAKIDSDSGAVLAPNVTYATPTITNTPAGTNTFTGTYTSTRTQTPTFTDSGTATGTFTITDTNTGTVSPSATPTRTSTPTATPTPTRTFTPHPSFVQTLYVLDQNGTNLDKFDADALAGGNTTPLLSQALTLPYGGSLKGLAKHPTNGLYYTLIQGSQGQDRDLATLDLDTGVISIIGNTGLNAVSLAFTPDGKLWAMSGNNTYQSQLFTLDISTGQPTFRMDYSNTLSNDSRALAYNAALGRLMLINSSSIQLYSIDPSTLALQAISVGQSNLPNSPASLYVLGSNLLFVGDRSGRVDLMTGDGVVLGNFFVGSGYVTGIVSGPDFAFTTTLTPSNTPTPFPTPAGVFYTGSGADLVQVSVSSLTQIDNVTLSLGAIGISKILGLAKHPVTGVLYALVTKNSGSDRRLISVDPVTGVSKQLATLDNLYAAMSFDGVGNLYLITTGGSNNPRNELFRFDWDQLAAVPVKALPGVFETGRNYDGAAIAFNSGDGKLYFLGEENNHDSTVFGRYDLSNFSYQALTIKGSFGTKVKGLSYYNYGLFYAADDNDNVYSLSVNGDLVNLGGSQEMKGLLLANGVTMVSNTPTPAPTAYPTPALVLYHGRNNGDIVQEDMTGSELASVRAHVGPRNVSAVLGLAKNPLTGVYFAIINLNNSQDRILATVDPASGETKVIGPTNHILDALAFDTAGTLYAASTDIDGPVNSLYSVNLATAACTFLRHLPGSGARARYNYNALAFDPDNGRLYWGARETNSGQDDFGSFDTGSWTYEDLASNSNDVETVNPRGLAYYQTGIFYGIRDDGGVFTLDTTGKYTAAVGAPGTHCFGAVFDAPRPIVTSTPTETGTPFPTPVNSLYGFRGNSVNFDEMDGRGNNLATNIVVADPAYPTFTHFYGAARHPNGTYYVVLGDGNLSTDRRLGRLNLVTGQLTYIGVTAGNLINLAFAADGTLYGVTGNNSQAQGRSLVTVNITNGAITYKAPLPSQDGGGGAIAFNPADGKLYVAATLNSITTFGRYTLPGLSYEALTLTASTQNYPRSMTYYNYGIFYLSDYSSNLYTLNVNGSLDLINNDSSYWGLIMAPHVNVGTVTQTGTISPTFSVTETANGTFTETPTFSESPTMTMTVTPSSTPSETPTLSSTPTFNLSDTATSTKTVSATLTVTKTVTNVPTLTATRTIPPTRTVTVTNTPNLSAVPTSTAVGFTTADGVLGSNLGISMGAVRRGEDLVIGFAGTPDSTGIEIYNFNGERISTAALSGSRQAVQTGSFAPGIYLLKMNIKLLDGRTQERWQKIAILP